MKYLYMMVLIIAWISGIVIAKGFFSTLVAMIFPIWSYYLTIELLLTKFVL
jgi:hypothetical protein